MTPTNNENLNILFYKLSLDILFLSLFLLGILLLSEIILPGILSAHLSFLKTILFLIAIFATTNYFSRRALK